MDWRAKLWHCIWKNASLELTIEAKICYQFCRQFWNDASQEPCGFATSFTQSYYIWFGMQKLYVADSICTDENFSHKTTPHKSETCFVGSYIIRFLLLEMRRKTRSYGQFWFISPLPVKLLLALKHASSRVNLFIFFLALIDECIRRTFYLWSNNQSYLLCFSRHEFPSSEKISCGNY